MNVKRVDIVDDDAVNLAANTDDDINVHSVAIVDDDAVNLADVTLADVTCQH